MNFWDRVYMKWHMTIGGEICHLESKSMPIYGTITERDLETFPGKRAR